MSNTKLAIDNKFFSVSFPSKSKDEKVYIPPFKRNHKEKVYVARLDKGKSSDVDAEVSKPKSKFTGKLHKKTVFVLTCHLCGVVSHIRPNCFLLRQKPKSETRFVIRNIDAFKFVPVCPFYVVSSHIHPNYHKLKFKHFVFQFRVCDDISPAISPNKLFHMLLKNLSLLACERKLQDVCLSQKKFVIPQVHSASHGSSPTKPKTLLYGWEKTC